SYGPGPRRAAGAPTQRPGFETCWNTTMTSDLAVPPAPDGLTSRDFPVLWPVLTRWADNDMFGHLNNAVYYQLFDTPLTAWINTNIGIDPLTISSLGIVAASRC